MRSFKDKNSSQSNKSVNPIALNLQTRPFAPIQLDDEAQVDQTSQDQSVQEKYSPSHSLLERLQERLLSNPPSEEIAPVQRKFHHRLQSSRMAIQAKLSIGEPNDKYEQEADATAAKVVQQINAPQNQSVQRQGEMEESDDELQMKPISTIQRDESMEEDELQMKSLVQRRENIGGGEASTDLESSIQSARGGGQSLDAGLQQSMGQSMGADFSRVKVHTDAQSDQLNQSIQAKAFTTGQDVFFRQGAYEPSSRGGQELIAHELTHVVQQNGKQVIQRTQGDEKYFATKKVVDTYKNEGKDSQTALSLIIEWRHLIRLAGPDGEAHARTQAAGNGWSDKDFSKHVLTPKITQDESEDKDLAVGVKAVKEEKKEKYEVKGGSSLTQGGKPFDTSKCQTNGSGANFAIFVMDKKGKIYAASHKLGVFHHSSFLAGQEVASAGEMKVTNGKLDVITNKSGHYEPTRRHLYFALKELETRGVALGGVDVRVFNQETKKLEKYEKDTQDAQSFLKNHEKSVEKTNRNKKRELEEEEEKKREEMSPKKYFATKGMEKENSQESHHSRHLENLVKDCLSMILEDEEQGKENPQERAWKYVEEKNWTRKDFQNYVQNSVITKKGVKSRKRLRVKYLKGAEKNKYEVKGGNPLKQGETEEIFDTSKSKTVFSGAGYAIFVMTSRGKIYAAHHKEGLFHHSSFLAGQDVASAGEMKVINGSLKEITNKSGHYLPTKRHLYFALQELKTRNVKLQGVKVFLLNKDKMFNKQKLSGDALDYLERHKEPVEHTNRVKEREEAKSQKEEAKSQKEKEEKSKKWEKFHNNLDKEKAKTARKELIKNKQKNAAEIVDENRKAHMKMLMEQVCPGEEARTKRLKEFGLTFTPSQNDWETWRAPWGDDRTHFVTAEERLQILKGEVTLATLQSRWGTPPPPQSYDPDLQF